jgi:zinc/manganese transport system substrate-binding protein
MLCPRHVNITRLLAFAVALVPAGCAAGAQTLPPTALHVVATTTLLASLASDVGGSRASVSSLLPVGASPETYQPSPRDIARLHDAAVIVENGAGLEAWLAPTLRSGAAAARLIVCTDGLPVVDANPHLWLDTVYAQHYVAQIRDGFIAADPGGATTYRANAAALDVRLAQLGARIRTRIATIPPANRVMIVFHNAWLYYNKRFGLRTLGVIEEVPGTEPSAEHLARLVDIARAAGAKAIFAEPEYNPKLVDAVARSAGIPHVAVLYDDSVGTSPQTRDYVSMLDTDTDTIVAALR